MSSTSERSRDLLAALEPEDVRAYLLEHPDFLEDNADLLTLLAPPDAPRGDGVEDFQRYRLAKLQDDYLQLQAEHDDLLDLMQEHLQRQNRFHAAMLALMDAPDFFSMLQLVGHEFPALLEQEAVGFFLEAGGWLDMGDYDGLRVVAPGVVNRWLNGGETVLEEVSTGSPDIFGDKADLVRSQALVRITLREGMPPGLLALGHRDPMHYATDLATEQVECLGSVIERVMRKWLT